MTPCNGWQHSDCEGTPYCPPRCPRFFDTEGTPTVVRPFRDQDRSDLVSMYDELENPGRSQGIPPRERDAIAEWIDGLTDRGLNLVCLVDKRVVGHIAAVPASSPTPELSIFVHQEFQNRGIGTELLKQLIAYSAAGDKEQLRLIVSTGNRRAITVYENIGFERVERDIMEIEMALSLENPVATRVRKPPAERG